MEGLHQVEIRFREHRRRGGKGRLHMLGQRCKESLVVSIHKGVGVANTGAEENPHARIFVCPERIIEFLLRRVSACEDMVVHGRGDTRPEEPGGAIGNVVVNRKGIKCSGVPDPRFEGVVESPSLEGTEAPAVPVAVDQARNEQELLASHDLSIGIPCRKLFKGAGTRDGITRNRYSTAGNGRRIVGRDHDA
jgi:hypothetical protein